jgi:hypothetical protein
MAEPSTKLLRGFALFDTDYQRKVASMGGRTAHAKGTAHVWTSETGREAALKSAAIRKEKRAAQALPKP